MKSFISVIIIYFLVLFSSSLFAQHQHKKVTITGVRFAYPLVEKWIQEYKNAYPSANIEIAPRSATDPSQYDLLIEAYEPEETVRENREYLYVARYALLPVANASSSFAKLYGEKGLTRDLIEVLYFNDIYADKKEAPQVGADYTIYTRLQKAGAPITFAKYFGFTQANIKGKAVAGADEHLIKALLKDSTGISYSVPGLLYDLGTRKQIVGLSVIPVDTDENRRVTKEEKFYENLDEVIARLENEELKNIPVEYLHLSISKHDINPEALKFLRWVLYNGHEALNEFAFLKPDAKVFQKEKEKFEELARNEK